MSSILSEKELPAELTPQQAVESAYAHELVEISSKLRLGLPCLVECDKDLAPFVFMHLRTRLRDANMRCVYLDGRPREGEQAPPPSLAPMGLMGMMIAQIRDAVRGALEKRVI